MTPIAMIMIPKILCIHLPAVTYLFPSFPRMLLVTVQSGIMGTPWPKPKTNNNSPPMMIEIFCVSVRIKTGIINDRAHGAHPIEKRMPKKNAPR